MRAANRRRQLSLAHAARRRLSNLRRDALKGRPGRSGFDLAPVVAAEPQKAGWPQVPARRIASCSS